MCEFRLEFANVVACGGKRSNGSLPNTLAGVLTRRRTFLSLVFFQVYEPVRSCAAVVAQRGSELLPKPALLCSSYGAQRSVVVRAAKARLVPSMNSFH